MAGKSLNVSWSNLDAFYKELLTLPQALHGEANAILLKSAQAAKAEISAAYPRKPDGTGNLRRGLVLRPARGRLFAGAILRNVAKHAWIYEHGTKLRRLLGNGMYRAGTKRGRMPPHNTFHPIAEAHQRAAVAAIIELEYAHGASQVTGDVDAA
jgi:hypothetical protein